MPKRIHPFQMSVVCPISLSIRENLMVWHTEDVCKVSSKSENVSSDDLLSISRIAQLFEVFNVHFKLCFIL